LADPDLKNSIKGSRIMNLFIGFKLYNKVGDKIPELLNVISFSKNVFIRYTFKT